MPLRVRTNELTFERTTRERPHRALRIDGNTQRALRLRKRVDTELGDRAGLIDSADVAESVAEPHGPVRRGDNADKPGATLQTLGVLRHGARLTDRADGRRTRIDEPHRVLWAGGNIGCYRS